MDLATQLVLAKNEPVLQRFLLLLVVFVTPLLIINNKFVELQNGFEAFRTEECV